MKKGVLGDTLKGKKARTCQNARVDQKIPTRTIVKGGNFKKAGTGRRKKKKDSEGASKKSGLKTFDIGRKYGRKEKTVIRWAVGSGGSGSGLEFGRKEAPPALEN